uniref:Uncharacterized protein n=1 Tax=Leersia perrieri TaxID=77586 RepID=A0A0D9VYW1_9ORYZ
MPAAAAAVAGGMATGPGSRVTRYAKSTAASVTPVRPGKTHALSALDAAMERHAVHLVLYYRAAPGLDRDLLKESLSDVLSQYPAMTGRLTRAVAADGQNGGWVVKCNDAGVRMVDAKAAATLDEWLATASGDEEMDLAYFEPMGPDPYIWSPFYVQLTEFSDKSYALGLSCTHLHNDPIAAVLFLNAWAAAHRRDSPYPPFLHSPALAVKSTAPPPEHPLLAAKSKATPTTTEMSSATFRFPPAAMRALLAAVDPATSPFAALAALFWLRIVAVAGDGDGEEREMTLAIDFRKRMNAPLPTGYYGTAVHLAAARADVSSGLAHVAAAVERRVAAVREEELWPAIEWLHARQAAGGEPFQMYGPELTCVALDHVPLYGGEFLAGVSPARAACRVGEAPGEGVVLVLPSPDGEAARDVAVTLPAEVTARICRDGEVLRYGAEVVFGPKLDDKAA